MINSKQKMSASYKAIFFFSIFMFFFVFIAGAVTQSKSSGLGMWVWGYTAWLMFKRRNDDLASFYKFILWFDVIAASVAIAVLVYSENDVSRFVGFSASEVLPLFAVVISITYGLYKYFDNLTSLPILSVTDANTDYSTPQGSLSARDRLVSNSVSEIESTASEQARNLDPGNIKSSLPSKPPSEECWAGALSEFDGDKRRPGLWARVFAEANGQESIAKAAYLTIRATELQGMVPYLTNNDVVAGTFRPPVDQPQSNDQLKKRDEKNEFIDIALSIDHATKVLIGRRYIVQSPRNNLHIVAKDNTFRYFYSDQEFISFSKNSD